MPADSLQKYIGKSKEQAMSLSEKAISHQISLARSERPPMAIAFPLALVCVALVLILVSAIFSPIGLDAPGAAESFLVGP
jgi:hypothetical protein